MTADRMTTYFRIGIEFSASQEQELRAFAEPRGWEVVRLVSDKGFAPARTESIRIALRQIKEGRRETRSGRPVGRPRRLTPKRVQRILDLRERGVKWSKVAQLVGLPVGTCRRAPMLAAYVN